MAIIDADAHVIENERTWDYLDAEGQRFRPMRLTGTGKDQGKEFWFMDGHLKPLRRGTLDAFGGGQLQEKVQPPEHSVSMEDVAARLRHMDELGTDLQVLFPTLFINPYTDRADIELAYSRAYNRWLAGIWREGGGRLRWAVVLPLRTMDEAMTEMRYAKEHGACAVFMRGIECGDKLLNDPYFFPVYDEALKLDLSVCVHTGNGSFALSDFYAEEAGFSRFKLVGVGAFHHVVYNEVPKRFPGLRFGFIELSSQWIPYALNDIARRFERMERPFSLDVLREQGIYVTCQTSDDLPYIIGQVGDDNLVIGTDYGHADSATELFALRTFSALDALPAETRRKILDDNARALYGLNGVR